MANFDISYKKTAKTEGGYTNNKDDGGNWSGGKVGVGVLIGTNLGISAPVLADYLKRIPTVQEMKSLSPDTAKKIYEKNYWNKIRGNEILIQEVADSIYDSGVNMGVGRAIKLAQRSLSLTENGIMDNATLAALNNNKKPTNPIV